MNSSDDYSSRHDNYSQGYQSLEGHLQGIGMTSDQHYSVRYDDRTRQRHNDHGEYCNTDYSSTGEYSTSSVEYRDFRYCHCRADIVQPPPSYTVARSSSQSSQPTGSHQQTYYYLYGNYIYGFYTYRGDGDNDDFVPHRHSIWK